MTNTNNEQRQARRHPASRGSSQKKRTPFRRAQRPQQQAPFSDRAQLSGAENAFELMEDADGFGGFAEAAIATDIVNRATRPVNTDAPTEKLQKTLADAGLGSRRAMEALIQTGTVTVNGKKATLGDRVTVDDIIRVEGRLVARDRAESTTPRVLMYHKPSGQIVSRDEIGRAHV